MSNTVTLDTMEKELKESLDTFLGKLDTFLSVYETSTERTNDNILLQVQTLLHKLD